MYARRWTVIPGRFLGKIAAIPDLAALPGAMGWQRMQVFVSGRFPSRPRKEILNND